MVVWVIPPEPTGHCITLDAGQLDVTVYTAGPMGPARPVGFAFYGYRGRDPAAALDVPIDSRTPKTYAVGLAGGRYCYTLTNQVPVTSSTSMADRVELGQEVGLRMVLSR